MDVAFYLKLGFGRQERGFESGSLFMRDMGVFLNFVLFGWWRWWFYFDFLGDYF